MVSKMINLAMRVSQFIWTLLIMSLVGNMIHEAFSGNPSSINYTMFVSVFSMLSLFYLIPATLEFINIPIVTILLDVLNTLFFLCAAIALSAFLGVHSCGNSSYTLSNHITNGSYNRGKRCHEAQASTAFLWFGFASYAASAVLSGLQSRGANLRSGGIRRGPAMSQV